MAITKKVQKRLQFSLGYYILIYNQFGRERKNAEIRWKKWQTDICQKKMKATVWEKDMKNRGRG